jgi:HAD superfamily hydrolase (TIGR01490 family)
VAGPDPGRTVAAFDFDGTLTRRDTLVPFLARLAGWTRVALAAAAATPELGLAVVGRGERDAAKARVLARVLTGRSYQAVLRQGEKYGAELARAKIRTEMRERLAWHRARGHEIVIVSASLAAYLDTVGRLLEVDTVLSTALEVDAHGACTGRMLGGNCRGEEKARRLRAYLDIDGCATAELWVYGDSAGDNEMLAMADHAVRVRSGFQEMSLPAMPTA